MATKFYTRVDGGDGVVQTVVPLTWRGSWDSTPAPGVSNTGGSSMMDPQQFLGAASSHSVAETSATNPWRVALRRQLSRPLTAQTISGTLDFILACRQSAAGALFHWKIYAYVRVGVTNAVRGVLLDYEDTLTEWPTSGLTTGIGMAMPGGPAALSAVDAEEGDQLVIEIGYIARNSVTTSFTGTLRTGSMLGSFSLPLSPMPDLTDGSPNGSTEAGTITFSQDLTFVTLANDTFAGATALTATQTIQQDMLSATWDGEEPTPCSGAANSLRGRLNSVWFSWACPVSQSCTVSAEIVEGVSSVQTILMVLTGTPGAFTTVDCRAVNDPTTEVITFAATGGVTYIVLVASEYAGGGQLTFIFTPDVPPVTADETIVGTQPEPASLAAYTAMGWVKLLTAVAAIRHFFYIGEGDTPFVPGQAYIYIGTAVDGVTLTLNIYDGTTAFQYTGPVLSLNTWYHWAYVKAGDVHNLYLSTELGVPLNLSLAIGPQTQDPGFTIPAASFIYGTLGFQVPKALKIWEAALTLVELALERETYRGVRHEDLLVVGQWRVAGGSNPGLVPNYSGWPDPFNNPIEGGGTTWDTIVGPELAQLPARPFSDNFEAYLAGDYDGNYTPGVIDPAANWEFPTAPAFQAYINPANGIAGSQGFDSRQVTATVWFEHDAYTGRCGTLSVWSFKRSDSQVALRHGVAAQVKWLPDPLFNATGEGFGFSNNGPGVPIPNDTTLYVFNTYPTTVWAEVPNVYLLDQWQFFQFYWILSTVNATNDGVEADGELYIYVDGTLRYSATGLQLTCTDTDWATDLNSWNVITLPWGGVIDNVDIGVTCFAGPSAPLTGCPGIVS